MNKKCWSCKCEKPVTEFYRSKRSNDGYQSECKSCCIARVGAKSKTVEGKNQPSARKAWADGIIRTLHLTDNDY